MIWHLKQKTAENVAMRQAMKSPLKGTTHTGMSMWTAMANTTMADKKGGRHDRTNIGGESCEGAERISVIAPLRTSQWTGTVRYRIQTGRFRQIHLHNLASKVP